MGDRLLDILHLSVGVFLELLGIEVRTRAELQDLLTEGVADGVVGMEVRLVDDVVQGCPREVTQQDGLSVCLWLETPQGIGDGTVLLVRETGGKRGDVHEEVRLHHNELGLDGLSLPMTVQQVKLHTLCQQGA